MTTLDDRAHAAAEAIHESVAEYAPAAPMPVLVRRHTMWHSLQWAAATAAAVVAIAGIALLTNPVDDDEVTEPTLPVTTLPTPTTIVERDVAPVEPTTTTAAPAVPAAPTTTAADTTPPPLAITSPAPDTHFDTKFVTFTGETEPGAAVVAAGKFSAVVDGDGRWSIQLVLAPGKNGASFVATDAAGNATSASIVVWYDEPAAEKPPKDEEPKAVVPFTAYKTYGSCNESPPYDVYYGTAAPGTKVEILSPYGSGSVTADANGNWEKKVHFETAPYGEVFSVKVKDHTGARYVFEFVSYAEG